MKWTPFLLLFTLQAGEILSQEPFENLDFLIGNWQGMETGVAGNGVGFRTYRLELGQNYIFEQNTSTFPPSENRPPGEVHRDIENNPGNWKARTIITKVSGDEFVEEFTIAMDGENFQPFIKNAWKRVK